MKKTIIGIGAALSVMFLGAAAANAGEITVQVKVPMPGDVRLWDPPHEKIFIQELLERVKAKHPDILYMGVHSTPPGLEDEVIVASSSDNNIIGLTSDNGIDSFARRDREYYSFHGLNKTTVKLFGPGVEVATAYLKLEDRNGDNLGLLIVFLQTKASTSVADTYAEFQGIQKEYASEIADKNSLYMAHGHLAVGKEH